ncbi:hypothetical protein CEXT_265831 [Caerostris extrusa]|uniref:Uncharacterized protein n=1 Tax=Caerostris extrusa TaxID=172846 RepID=A0AAV4PEL5_CAEEX|nr:hypothetical protein CEXT_265831 [Caerostris extrusa]
MSGLLFAFHSLRSPMCQQDDLDIESHHTANILLSISPESKHKKRVERLFLQCAKCAEIKMIFMSAWYLWPFLVVLVDLQKAVLCRTTEFGGYVSGRVVLESFDSPFEIRKM